VSHENLAVAFGERTNIKSGWFFFLISGRGWGVFHEEQWRSGKEKNVFGKEKTVAGAAGLCKRCNQYNSQTTAFQKNQKKYSSKYS